MGHRTRHRIALLVAVLVVLTTIIAVAPAAGAVVCASTPAGLSGRWPGDGSTVEVAHGRDGTLVGDATYGAGKVGQAFSLDGNGDMVTAPDDPDWAFLSNDFTVDTWVNFAADTGEPTVLVASDTGAGYLPKWILWRRDGTLGFFVNDPSEVAVINAPWTLTLGQWYHVAVTRSGSTFTMYIDGVSVATATNHVVVPDASAPLTIGSSEGGFWFKGSIDEPEVYQRALSDTEIAAIHGQGGAARCGMTTSSLSLLATPTSALGGATISLSGALSLSSGTVNGTPIEVTRSVNGAPAVTLTTVPAAPDGSFAYDDVPPSGTITYRAVFAGGIDVAAASGWATATVTQQTSALSLAVSTHRVRYGGSVKVTAHLEGGSTNRVVTIYAQPAGGTKKVLKRGIVGGSGNLVVTTEPTRTTTYSAKYTGETAWKPSSSKEVEVVVAARWKGQATGGYATVNGYRLYHYSPTCTSGSGKTCPAAAFALAPNHAGQRVYFRGRYCGDGHCFDDQGTFRLDRKSVAHVYVFYRDRSVIGWTISMRFIFPGDSDHASSFSRWVKTKVTA